MTNNKNKDREQETNEEKFTGSPEQQLPDLEAEDQQDRQQEQFKNEAQESKQKDD